MDDDSSDVLPKPDALLALDGVTAELFETLRDWFDVGPTVTLDLRRVDSAVADLGDPQLIAAMAMRKLQALHLLSTPGVRTTTDVVVAMVNDLDRALVQAPSMFLERRVTSIDWDDALAELDGPDSELAGHAPREATDSDPEIERFRVLHLTLHEAVRAVLEAAEGEIRLFE